MHPDGTVYNRQWSPSVPTDLTRVSGSHRAPSPSADLLWCQSPTGTHKWHRLHAMTELGWSWKRWAAARWLLTSSGSHALPAFIQAQATQMREHSAGSP